MKNPHSKNTRAAVAVGDALFSYGEYDSAAGGGILAVVTGVSLVVGLAGIGVFPLLAILLLTCSPVAIWGILFLWLYTASPHYESYDNVCSAYNKSQLCSNSCRDIAETIVRDIVRINKNTGPAAYKKEAIDKRVKALNKLYDEDVRLQNEIAKQGIDSTILDEVNNAISAMSQARIELAGKNV